MVQSIIVGNQSKIGTRVVNVKETVTNAMKEEEKKKVRTLRSTTFAVMAMNVSAAGYNFKSFTDKKKWLAEKRMWTRQIVS